jgi:hypothetical protein
MIDESNRMESLGVADIKRLYPYVLEAAAAEPDETKRGLLEVSLSASAVPEGPLFGEDAFLHLLHQQIQAMAPIIDEHGLSMRVVGVGEPLVPLATVNVDLLDYSEAQRRYLDRIAEVNEFVDFSGWLDDEDHPPEGS